MAGALVLFQMSTAGRSRKRGGSNQPRDHDPDPVARRHELAFHLARDPQLEPLGGELLPRHPAKLGDPARVERAVPVAPFERVRSDVVLQEAEPTVLGRCHGKLRAAPQSVRDHRPVEVRRRAELAHRGDDVVRRLDGDIVDRALRRKRAYAGSSARAPAHRRATR